jgi:predicted DNA-binding transcriptional regulator AlpA
LREVMYLTGLCRSAVYNLIKRDERFPRRRKISGTRSAGWSYVEVQGYIHAILTGGEQQIVKNQRGAK